MLEESRIEARVQMRPVKFGATSAHLMVSGWFTPTTRTPDERVDAEPTPVLLARYPG